MYFDEDAEGDKVYYYLYLAIYQHEDLQQNGMWDILAISRRRIYHCLSVGWRVCKYLKFSNKTNKWKSLWQSPIEWWCWFYLTLTQPLGNTRFNGLSGIPPIACQLYYLDIKMLVETNIVLGYQNGVGKNDDCKQSVNNMHHVDNIRYQAMFRDCCLIGMELNVSGSLSLSIERDCELIEGDALFHCKYYYLHWIIFTGGKTILCVLHPILELLNHSRKIALPIWLFFFLSNSTRTLQYQ